MNIYPLARKKEPTNISDDNEFQARLRQSLTTAIRADVTNEPINSKAQVCSRKSGQQYLDKNHKGLVPVLPRVISYSFKVNKNSLNQEILSENTPTSILYTEKSKLYKLRLLYWNGRIYRQNAKSGQ